MPELPEVETVRRYLNKNLIGDKVNEVILCNDKSLRNVSKKIFSTIAGQEIIGTDRLAKHLILNLTNNYLIMHLRMEGKFFIFNTKKEMELKTNRFHDVLILETNKHIILFQDTRRFATIDMFDNKIALEDNPILIKVAKEPFDIDPKELFKKLNKKRVSIKSAILDQTLISGIGNIYADEILYDVKIHPETKSNEITLKQVQDIVKSSIKILKKATELKGTTIKSFSSALNVNGEYQKYLKVHQKQGQKCSRDGNLIKKIKVGGRGTYLCDKCQKFK